MLEALSMPGVSRKGTGKRKDAEPCRESLRRTDGLALRQRDARRDAGAPGYGRLDRDPAAELTGPLLHPEQAERPGARADAGLDAPPVVVHLEGQVSVPLDERDLDPRRARMAQDVRDGLLIDPEERGLDGARQARVRDVGTERHAHARPLAELVGLPLEGFEEPEVVEDRGTQVGRDPPHGEDRRVGEPDEPGDLL